MNASSNDHIPLFSSNPSSYYQRRVEHCRDPFITHNLAPRRRHHFFIRPLAQGQSRNGGFALGTRAFDEMHDSAMHVIDRRTANREGWKLILLERKCSLSTYTCSRWSGENGDQLSDARAPIPVPSTRSGGLSITG